MNNLIEMTLPPGVEHSRAVRLGRKLIALAFALRALNGFAAALLMLVFGAATFRDFAVIICVRTIDIPG